MTVRSSRMVIGMTSSWVLIFEGFFALSIADAATILGIGRMDQTTFTIAAVQLVLLGVIISASWAFKSTLSVINISRLNRVMVAIVYLAMTVVTVEGLVMIFLAGDATITGWGKVGKGYVVLFGAQLCALGLLSLRNWKLRDIPPTNWAVDLMGSMAAILLVLEGLTAIGIAGDTVIQGFGGIMGSTFFYAGLQLLLLGSLLFIMWTMLSQPATGSRLSKVLSERRALVLMSILGGLVALEGIVASTLAGRVTIADIGDISKVYVVAGCAQLFTLGLLSPLLWKLRIAPADRRSLLDLLTMTAMTLLAFEGVFAMGLAARTDIEGLGTILERTFLLAGAQLLVLSLLGLAAFMVKGNPPLGRWGGGAVSSLPIAALTVIGLEGLAAMVLAARMTISDLGGIRESYVLLGGIQMTLLSAMALILWARSHRPASKHRTVATASALFLLLMTPLAILM